MFCVKKPKIFRGCDEKFHDYLTQSCIDRDVGMVYNSICVIVNDIEIAAFTNFAKAYIELLLVLKVQFLISFTISFRDMIQINGS